MILRPRVTIGLFLTIGFLLSLGHSASGRTLTPAIESPPPLVKPKRIAVLDLEDKHAPPQILELFSHAIIAPLTADQRYHLVPGTPLDEVKLLFGCVNERPACMGRVGEKLRADRLLWGSLQKSSGVYRITLTLLDITNKRIIAKRTAAFSPTEALTPAARVSRLVRSLLSKEYGFVRIRTKIPGTRVAIDGKMIGRPAGQQLIVLRVPVGKHVVLAKKDGFFPLTHAIATTPGDTTEVTLVLQPRKAPQKTVKGNKNALTGKPSRTAHISRRSGWETMFWLSAALAIGTASALIPNGIKVKNLEDDKDDEIGRLVESGTLGTSAKQALRENGCTSADAVVTPELRSICDRGKTHALVQNVLIGTSAGLAVATALLAYKAFFANQNDNYSKERAQTNQNKFANTSRAEWHVVPSVAPNGANVSVQLTF